MKLLKRLEIALYVIGFFILLAVQCIIAMHM